jgi:hypothetical protein
MNKSSRAALAFLGLCILGFDSLLLVGVITIPFGVQEEYNYSDATIPPGKAIGTFFFSRAPIFETFMEFQDVTPVSCNISVICSETTIQADTVVASGNASELSALGYNFTMQVLRFPESLDTYIYARIPLSADHLNMVFYTGNYSDGTANAANTSMTFQIWVHGRITTDAWWLSWGGPAFGYVLGACGGFSLIVLAALKRLHP